MVQLGHAIAACFARAAGGDAILHIFQLLAARDAGGTDFGTLAAEVRVVGGTTCHKVGCGGADLRAVSMIRI